MFESPRAQSGAFAVAAALFLLAHLGEVHLAPHDDAYYASKASAMLESGDWVTPRFAGRPRFDNPPLFLWLVAGSFGVLGESEWSAVLPSALAGVLCVWLLHRLGLRLGGPVVAFVAAGTLLTSAYFLRYARQAMMDPLLTLLCVAAILAYVVARDGDRRAYLLCGLAVGAGVLTKSALGLFPYAVIAVHLLWCGRARELRDPWLVAGVGLALLVCAPWYAAVGSLHGKTFFDEHFGWLLWQRAYGGGASERGYLVRFAEDYWPWLPLALAALARELKRAFFDRDETARLLVAWFFVVVGTMSTAGAKDLRYVMMTFPALSLACGRLVEPWLAPPRRFRIARAWLGVCIAGAAVVAILPVPLDRPRQPHVHALALEAARVGDRGEVVVNLDRHYWSIAPVFFYYSRRDLTQPLGDGEEFVERVRSGSLGLASRSAWERSPGGLELLAESGDLVLVGPPD